MEGDGKMEGNDVTRILLMDDDQDLFEYYDKFLQGKIGLDIEIDNCLKGKDLPEKLSEKNFDIVILDHRLADGERGIDLIPMIRERSPKSRIVLNSAYGNEELAVSALREGVDDYVGGNKENDEMLIFSLKRIISGIDIEREANEMVSRSIVDMSRIASFCEEKMRRLEEKVGRMNQVVSIG